MDLEPGEIVAMRFNGKVGDSNLAVAATYLLADPELTAFINEPPTS